MSTQRVTDAQLQRQIVSLAFQMDVPEELFHIGGSYGYTTVDIMCFDDNTGKLSSGSRRLFTGSKREVSEAIAFMLETLYQVNRYTKQIKSYKTALKHAKALSAIGQNKG